MDYLATLPSNKRVAIRDESFDQIRGARVRFVSRGELGPCGFLQRLRDVPPLVPCYVWPVRGSGWRHGAIG